MYLGKILNAAVETLIKTKSKRKSMHVLNNKGEWTNKMCIGFTKKTKCPMWRTNAMIGFVNVRLICICCAIVTEIKVQVWFVFLRKK